MSIEKYVTITENEGCKPRVTWYTEYLHVMTRIRFPKIKWIEDYVVIVFEILARKELGLAGNVLHICKNIQEGHIHTGTVPRVGSKCMFCDIEADWSCLGRGNQGGLRTCSYCYKIAGKCTKYERKLCGKKCKDTFLNAISYTTRPNITQEVQKEIDMINMHTLVIQKKVGGIGHAFGRMLIDTRNVHRSLSEIRSENHDECPVCNGGSNFCIELFEQIFVKNYAPKYWLLKNAGLCEDVVNTVCSMFTKV